MYQRRCAVTGERSYLFSTQRTSAPMVPVATTKSRTACCYEPMFIGYLISVTSLSAATNTLKLGGGSKKNLRTGVTTTRCMGSKSRCRTRCARGRRAMRLIGIRQISSSVDTSPRSIAHRLAQVQSLPAKSGLVPASHCNDDGFSRPGNRRDGVRRWIGGREFEQLDPCKRISGKALANPRAVPSADTSARCAAGGLSQDYRRQAVRGY